MYISVFLRLHVFLSLFFRKKNRNSCVTTVSTPVITELKNAILGANLSNTSNPFPIEVSDWQVSGHIEQKSDTHKTALETYTTKLRLLVVVLLMMSPFLTIRFPCKVLYT